MKLCLGQAGDEVVHGDAPVLLPNDYLILRYFSLLRKSSSDHCPVLLLSITRPSARRNQCVTPSVTSGCPSRWWHNSSRLRPANQSSKRLASRSASAASSPANGSSSTTIRGSASSSRARHRRRA